jgi:hypothetical protein
VNRKNLSSSFPICIFFSFSCLIALAKNPNNSLNKSGQYCIPGFRGNVFSFCPFCIILAIDFYHM